MRHNSRTIDLRLLLECPSSEFLPLVYETFFSRPPDASGLLHYAKQLQKGNGRLLCLLEARVSPEGQARATDAPCPELDYMVKRYLSIRNLPVGRLRWMLLPKITATPPAGEESFAWEAWANKYIAEQIVQDVQRPIQEQQAQTKENSPLELQAIETKLLQLQERMNQVAVALHAGMTALQAQGAPVQAIDALREAQTAALFSMPNPDDVPWEARQYLHVLAQALRA